MFSVFYTSCIVFYVVTDLLWGVLFMRYNVRCFSVLCVMFRFYVVTDLLWGVFCVLCDVSCLCVIILDVPLFYGSCFVMSWCNGSFVRCVLCFMWCLVFMHYNILCTCYLCFLCFMCGISYGILFICVSYFYWTTEINTVYAVKQVLLLWSINYLSIYLSLSIVFVK